MPDVNPPGGEYPLEIPLRESVSPLTSGELPSPVSAARSTIRPDRKRVGDFAALMGCNAIVFGTSVCLMVLELTASRLIAGYVGSSLYTWTSVIGVVLAGISIGNYLGGWLADRYQPQKLLGWQFLSAALLTLSVLFLNGLAASAERPEGLHWHWWVMLVVAWVFLLPSIALGTISPVVAAMALKRSVRTGITVGNIYAWGAMGSIVGTFLTGFWLIGELGTKQIIWMTATALMLMGVLVAGAQRSLRMVMLCGLLPWVLFIGICSSTTAERGGENLRSFAEAMSLWRTGSEAFARDREELQEATRNKNVAEIERIRRTQTWREERKAAEDAWENWGRQAAAQLHGLGIIFGLRTDYAERYFDESDYYAINIFNGTSNGDTVRQLRLDYLLHSYYNPVNPTKLYYDYERVYAAITERAANGWKRETRVTLSGLPEEVAATDLPEGVTWDAAGRTLSVRGGMTLGQLEDLLERGPSAAFRRGVLGIWEVADRDWRKASQANGGMIYVPLDELPSGVVISSELSARLRYDSSLKSLVCSGPILLEDALDLVAQGDDATYASAVTDLFQRSRKTSTMFIGGGGFVFPRWIESRFPFEPLIDVAEIDPAVKAAVEAEMGLPREFGPPRDGKTFVQTHLGDARKFVDEQLRENEKCRARGEPVVTYDFVYGDAFNDLSVPWHLTTREFSEKIRSLMTPGEGVYLVNIIDIYPRAQYPRASDKVATSTVSFSGIVPATLLPDTVPEDKFVPVRGPFPALEIRHRGKDFELRCTGPMPEPTRDSLQALADEDEPRGTSFASAISELHDRSQARRLLQSALPESLFGRSPAMWQWVPATEESGRIELYRAGSDGYMLGFRGVMDDATRDKLVALAAGNEELTTAIRELHRQSQSEDVGQFLGRYVSTAVELFDYVYIFTSNEDGVSDVRDTFVVACSLKPLDLSDLPSAGGHWRNGPFAWTSPGTDGRPAARGEMPAILELARGKILTDNFAPVDNLLAPVFVSRSGDTE